MDKLLQLQTDITYLAKRHKIIEDGVIRLEDALLAYAEEVNEWSEFLTKEMLRQGVSIHKNKRSFEYFRSTLNQTHKQNYEKFESVFLKIKQLFGERKNNRYTKYTV